MVSWISSNLIAFKKACMNYCKIVDKALGSSHHPHRTLRTCFDPGSEEWKQTTIEEKIEILRQITAVEDLTKIIMKYKLEYIQMNKPHVAKSVEDGVIILLQHTLTHS